MKKFFFPCFLALYMSLFPLAYGAVIVKDLNGVDISLEALSGKWIFINYWASWCGPCVDEIAELNRFYKTNHAAGVEVFAVNFDAPSIAAQLDLAAHFHINYPSLNPTSLRPLHLVHPTVVPVTYVFDPKGHLHTTLYGGQTNGSLFAVMKSYKTS